MSTEEIDKILARQSVELLEAVQRGEPQASERLANWLKQSKRHTEHYLMAVAFERELEGIEFDPGASVETLAGASNVVTLPDVPTPAPLIPSPGRRGRVRVGASAAAAAILATVGALHWQAHRNDFATAVGEQRTVALEDGSIVHLNTQSHVEVRLTENGRDIELLAGEALFKVRRDAARPFRVHAGGAVIQALGTEFNVYRRPRDTMVEVLEGRVKVVSKPGVEPHRSVDLDGGEQARIDRTGKISTEKLPDVAAAAAWRQRRLIFAGTPLPEIVMEFNRYNRAPQFALSGADAGERVYSGVFDADDPQSLIDLLKREPAMHVRREGNRVLIQVEDGKSQ